jgi:hypothetical protein
MGCLFGRDKMKLPKGVKLESMTFYQDADTCDDPDNIQYLTVEVQDSGAGEYYTIKTERWAFDNFKELLQVLKRSSIFL